MCGRQGSISTPWLMLPVQRFDRLSLASRTLFLPMTGKEDRAKFPWALPKNLWPKDVTRKKSLSMDSEGVWQFPGNSRAGDKLQSAW